MTHEQPEWEDTATVEIRTYLHVKIKGRGPHPDMVDWEAAGLALDRRIEKEGHLPGDVEVMYASVTSETEPWALVGKSA